MLFTGLVVLTGSLVHGLLVLFVWLGFMLWGRGAAVGHVHSFSLVWWFLFYFVWFGFARLVSCGSGWIFFIFFGLLFFLGALQCSAPAPTSRCATVLFSLSGEVDIYSALIFCWCFSVGMKENSWMQNSSRITCEIAISAVFFRIKHMQATFINHVWSDVPIWHYMFFFLYIDWCAHGTIFVVLEIWYVQERFCKLIFWCLEACLGSLQRKTKILYREHNSLCRG